MMLLKEDGQEGTERESVFNEHQNVCIVFVHRTVDFSNGLSEELVAAANIHIFKEKLHEYIYGDSIL